MILIIDNKSGFKDKLLNTVKALGVSYKLRSGWEVLTLADLEGVRGVIFSGGAINFAVPFNINDLIANFMVLSFAKVPVLGICMGHSAIGAYFGAKAGKLDNLRDTHEKISVVREDPIFDELPKEIELRTWHNDYVAELPEEFELLAKSEIGMEVMKHKNKPIYGIQSHPEASGEHGKQIFRNFFKICGIET